MTPQYPEEGKMCKDCDGSGYIQDHGQNCNPATGCNEPCPVQVQCPCGGHAPTSPVPTERSKSNGEGFTVNDRGVFDASGSMVKGYGKKFGPGDIYYWPSAPKDSGENRAIAERLYALVKGWEPHHVRIYIRSTLDAITAALDAKDAEIERLKVRKHCTCIQDDIAESSRRIAAELNAKITQLEADKKALIEFIQKVRIRAQTRGDEKDILLYIANICTDTLTPERSDTNNEPKGGREDMINGKCQTCAAPLVILMIPNGKVQAEKQKNLFLVWCGLCDRSAAPLTMATNMTELIKDWNHRHPEEHPAPPEMSITQTFDGTHWEAIARDNGLIVFKVSLATSYHTLQEEIARRMKI